METLTNIQRLGQATDDIMDNSPSSFFGKYIELVIYREWLKHSRNGVLELTKRQICELTGITEVSARKVTRAMAASGRWTVQSKTAYPTKFEPLFITAFNEQKEGGK